jgi:UDP-GlcNAc:undecaprenyl-phosphate GlcNAc-1-phosphate transferase
MFACGGCLVVWLTIPAVLRHLHFLNRNGPSQFHHANKHERSRLGGLAIVASFLILSAAGLWFSGDGAQTQISQVIVCSATAMFLLGFWDDLKPLGAKNKLAGQILIATLAWCGGVHIEAFRNPFSGVIYPLGSSGCVLTVFWLIALPNLINLVDGMDGLAGGIALMLMALLSYAGWAGSAVFPALCAAGMVGALIGFLRYNFPPASIFMGDGGAYFLGFLVAELSIVNSHKGTIVAALLAPLFVLALPIADTSLAILRRGLKGLPIFRPDRLHIHHRLLETGYTPRRVVLTFYFVSVLFLLFGLAVLLSEGRWAPVLFGIACLAFIVSALSFNFSREWFSVGRVVGNSIEMRESTHYALTLSRWLELEAGRCDSLENLWSDFKFLAMKLNFSRVKLSLQDGQMEWHRENGGPLPTAQTCHFQREFGGGCMALELEIKAEEWIASTLCDITCEAWQKAAARWESIHHAPATFKTRAHSRIHHRNQKGSRPYVPIPRGWSPGIGSSTP